MWPLNVVKVWYWTDSNWSQEPDLNLCSDEFIPTSYFFCKNESRPLSNTCIAKNSREHSGFVLVSCLKKVSNCQSTCTGLLIHYHWKYYISRQFKDNLAVNCRPSSILVIQFKRQMWFKNAIWETVQQSLSSLCEDTNYNRTLLNVKHQISINHAK